MNCQCGFGIDEKIVFYLQFNFCPCPMLKEVKRLESYTWCQCTTGYSKKLFEAAINFSVDTVRPASSLTSLIVFDSID